MSEKETKKSAPSASSETKNSAPSPNSSSSPSSSPDKKEKKNPLADLKPLKGNGGKPGGRTPRFPVWIYVVMLLILIAFNVFLVPNQTGNRIKYSDFLSYVEKGYVEEIVIINNSLIDGRYSDKAEAEGIYTVPQERNENAFSITGAQNFDRFSTVMLQGDDLRPLLDEYGVAYDVRQEEEWFSGMFVWLIPLALAVAFWVFIFRRMNPGQQVMNIGKNKAALYDKQSENKVSFKDVAGLQEAKAEVEEVVEFLKNPKKFTTLGGSLPKGVLLVGPPGTGKTLMARATAGEADVPFFSLSGSDFVEMFVGVGAARVRDLFKQAKEKAPCIIFIDEIDSIGRSRGKGMMLGSNDERENTLNQLLSEMDGFNSDKGVIIMAATNRPDTLDPALLRPGRFDRQILIDKPDLNGRVEVLEVHAKKLKLAKEIDLRVLASQTPGFAGAELANLCNEAALIAARSGKKAVEMVDFQDAIERVIAGLEKKNKLISPEERKIVAYHEAGHAIAGWFLKHTDPVLKVSIVPRGLAALGYTLQTPLEDRFLMTTEELNDRICALLGGRVAEEIIFGRISTGAQNDLERITNMAYAMVAEFGMSKELGYISLTDSKNPENSYGFNKKYSDNTAQAIDRAVQTIIRENHNRTLALLRKHRDKLELMATTLLEKEVLTYEDLRKMLGKRPYEDPNEGMLNSKSAILLNGASKNGAKGSAGNGKDDANGTLAAKSSSVAKKGSVKGAANSAAKALKSAKSSASSVKAASVVAKSTSTKSGAAKTASKPGSTATKTASKPNARATKNPAS